MDSAPTLSLQLPVNLSLSPDNGVSYTATPSTKKSQSISNYQEYMELRQQLMQEQLLQQQQQQQQQEAEQMDNRNRLEKVLDTIINAAPGAIALALGEAKEEILVSVAKFAHGKIEGIFGESSGTNAMGDLITYIDNEEHKELLQEAMDSIGISSSDSVIDVMGTVVNGAPESDDQIKEQLAEEREEFMDQLELSRLDFFQDMEAVKNIKEALSGVSQAMQQGQSLVMGMS